MVFVDSSVWIDFFRGGLKTKGLIDLLSDNAVALAALVRVELLSGASKTERKRLLRVLSALPTVYPSQETWELMEEWTGRAAGAGERFGLGDLLIGAIAAENSGEVWSHDADFTRMSRLGFVRLHR